MRALRHFTVALLVSVSVPALAQDGELSLKRVLLSTGGIAYLEHAARVTGEARLTLDVPLTQVDDVLKSLVVYDDAGQVAGMVLPGRQPLAQVFRDLPFPAEALGDPAALLRALRGAVLAVDGPTPLTGQIMSVRQDNVTDPEGRILQTRNRVTLATDQGLRQFVLEDATALVFQDEKIARQVREALAATLAHGAQDNRTVTVLSRGEGSRDLRIGYVVGAPLWKAAYRLSLGADDQGLLQGWAVLENMTGQDWDDVELTLASGSPVTFRQALYEAYYVARPEVPVEVFGRVLPPPDSGAIAPDEPRGRGEEEDRRQRAYAPRAMLESVAKLADGVAAGAAAPQPASPDMAPTAIAAEAEEAATQVLFRVPEPVDVAAGQTLSIPLIDRKISARQVSLYQPATHATHPLAAVNLKNESDNALPPGVLTLYQGGQLGAAFLGDARLAPLPAGEERLLSYAIDTKTKVDREVGTTSTLLRGSVARGVLRVLRSQRQTTTYTIAAPQQESRRLIIEQPRMSGWELVEPPADGVKVTDAAYRLPLELKAGETRTLTVALERQIGESLRILDLNDDQIGFFARAPELSSELRQAFQRLAELKRAVDAPADRIAELERERAAIFQDQSRIRDNMGRVSSNTDLHRRYLEKLQAQESRLEDIAEAIKAAQQRQQAARAALTAYVDGLKM
jgi:hypothetical protein